MKLLLIILAVIVLSGCTRNVQYIKNNAEAKWNSLGYSVVGYEGFKMSLAGGDVWYLVVRPENPRAVYSGFLESYFGELQVYGPELRAGNPQNITIDK